MSDMIDRQATIAEIMEDIKDRSLHDDPATPEDFAEGYDEGIRNAAAIVLQMPSAQPGWIPVTDRLPEEEGLYLVAGDFPPGAEVHIRYFNVLHDRSVWSGTMTDKVKWWMPIPNPPEGGQK